jgi:Uma2 family endonuclease
MTSLTLNLQPTIELNDEQFEQICLANRDLRFERTAKGELSAMAPAGSETGARNSSLTGQLWFWNSNSRLGKVFDSSAGFTLPNGAIRSPDASWIRQDRWDVLTSRQRQKFAPICPDFVVELCSPSDDLEEVRAKMREYLANGVQLGWLIDPEHQQVEIYRPNQPVEILLNPINISGSDLLPGFVLDLSEVL